MVAAVAGDVWQSPSDAAGLRTAGPSQIQATTAQVSGGSQVGVDLPRAVGAGDLIVAYLIWSNDATAVITDGAGHAYTPAAAKTTWATGYSAEVFYAGNAKAGPTHVTAQLSKPGSFALLYVSEYTGVAQDGVLDATQTDAGSGRSLDSGQIATTSSNDLLYGAGAAVASVSGPGRGFTARSLADGNITEDRIAGTAGSYSATAQQDNRGAWVMQVVAFKRGSTVRGNGPSASTPASSTPASASASAPSTSAASTPPVTVVPVTTPAAPPSAVKSSPATSATQSAGGGSTGSTCASYPNAGCTGVPAGQALTVVSADQTFDSSYNGQTISNKDFHGWVTVTGSNITFKNSIFRGRSADGANHALLDTENSAGTVTVTDSEFVPSNPSATIDGVWTHNTNLYRVNIHGSVDGMKAGSNTLVQDSYIHDMAYFASDPNQGGGSTHNDGVQILDGSNISLIHNNIATAGTDPNSAVQITQDFGAVGSVTINNNLVDYGGCTLNIAQKPLSSLTGVSVTNNRFGRHQAFAGCTVLIGSHVTLAAYSGNVWSDTGQAVPAVQQHD